MGGLRLWLEDFCRRTWVSHFCVLNESLSWNKSSLLACKSNISLLPGSHQWLLLVEVSSCRYKCFVSPATCISCLTQSANLLPLIALSEELKSEVQLFLCRLSVCTAVGSRQTLHFATLETVRFLHARKLFYLPAAFLFCEKNARYFSRKMLPSNHRIL